MSAAHTPWTISEVNATGEVDDFHIFIEPSVAVIERSVSGVGDMENARLIAAAPQLVEALQALVAYQNMGGFSGPVAHPEGAPFDKAEAALRAAGVTP